MDNKEYRQDANIAHSKPHYVVGQRVPIYCNPATPDKIAVAGTESIRNSVLFIVIGVIALTVGIILRVA